MITTIVGNLIENITPEITPLDTVRVIAHGTNCQGVMGSGFAAYLRKKYPSVFDVYYKEYIANGLTLGGCTATSIGFETFQLWNLNTQEYYRGYTHKDGTVEPLDKVYCDYDAVYNSFKTMSDEISTMFNLTYTYENGKPDTTITNIEVHFPLIGCGLANGDWAIVKSKIESAVDSRIRLFLWVLE